MPRQARIKSDFGIYHIMFRGNNKQNIFVDDEDRLRLISMLENLPLQYDYVTGKLLKSRNCDIYAFCLMSNHVHILFRELDEDIDHSMKRLLTSYAQYYNGKYARIGHVFQDRYRSEPCNDLEYFITLLRYIHQNPVKAHLTQTVAEYPWSSWNEFVNYGKDIEYTDGTVFTNVCNVKATLKRYPINELTRLVDELLPDETGCIDDNQIIRSHISDDDVEIILRESWHIYSPSDFEHLSAECQQKIIHDLNDRGVSYRQIARHTGQSFYQVGKSIREPSR